MCPSILNVYLQLIDCWGVDLHQSGHVSVGKAGDLLIRTSSVMYAHTIKVKKKQVLQSETAIFLL